MGVNGVFNRKLLKAVGIGIAVSILITFFAMCLCTTLITKEHISLNSTVVIIAIQGSASFLGATIAVRVNKTNIYWTTLLVSICYLLVLILLSVVLFQGVNNGVGACIISIIGGSVTSLLISINSHRGKKRRHNRKRVC